MLMVMRESKQYEVVEKNVNLVCSVLLPPQPQVKNPSGLVRILSSIFLFLYEHIHSYMYIYTYTFLYNDSTIHIISPLAF